MRALVIGGTGLVGSQLTEALENRRYPVLATCHQHPRAFQAPLDIRDTEAIQDLLEDYQPEVTFLAAGTSCPRRAVEQPAEARLMTVAAVSRVAAAVRDTGGLLILFSGSDLFGECQRAMREDDAVRPQGLLAALQAEAELIAAQTLPDRHLIIRTSRVYGSDLLTRLQRVRQGDSWICDDRCVTQPTLAADLAEVAVEAARRGMTGRLHVVGPDRLTEFALARWAALVFGADADLIVPDHQDPADRPERTWLDRFLLRSRFGAHAIRPVAEGLRMLRLKQEAHTPLRRMAA